MTCCHLTIFCRKSVTAHTQGTQGREHQKVAGHTTELGNAPGKPDSPIGCEEMWFEVVGRELWYPYLEHFKNLLRSKNLELAKFGS